MKQSKEIDIDEYLEDLKKSLDTGEEEKLYWQEDMDFLIGELKETRAKLRFKEKEVEDLNEFFNTYDIKYETNAVFIGKKEFLKCINVDEDFDIFIVNKVLQYEEEMENSKPWQILRIDNLALCYKTFVGRETSEKDIEICAFNDDNTRYTIASFNYNEKEDYYILKFCDKLNDEKIDWQVFGDLVKEGYKILDK